MGQTRVQLAEIELPSFGLPDVQPGIPTATYISRLENLEASYQGAGFDAFVVYADREHFANMAYLTAYDARFEEALLVLRPGEMPTLLVGNEGMTYATICPVPVQVVLCQTLSLPDQPRDTSPPLPEALGLAGLAAGMRVGVAGWKHFTEQDSPEPRDWIEIPSFMVDSLRRLGLIPQNANDLLMHADGGLRVVNDVHQLAAFEYSAAHASQGMRDLVFGMREGMTEYDACSLAGLRGMPVGFHPLVLSGERTGLGLGSPSTRRIVLGDPIVAAIGYWGSNTARAGFVAREAADLPAGIADYVERLVEPYFRAAVAWYETVGIGVTGGELYAAAMEHIGDPFFGVSLNPGHLIHLEEWLSSPVWAGSTIPLVSGMYWQVDMIPATGSPYFSTNIEDGIALADESLRAEMAATFPDVWVRIEARRAFMRDVLGIQLKPEVLPFSNMPAYLPPFWLAPGQAMRVSP
jgi:hypothetical protein